MVALCLFGLRRHRLEAVLTEPDGRARRGRRHAAHAQQLQQGFATGEPLRRACWLLRLAIGFFRHGQCSRFMLNYQGSLPTLATKTSSRKDGTPTFVEFPARSIPNFL